MNSGIKIGTKLFIKRAPVYLLDLSSFEEYRNYFLEHEVVRQTHACWILNDCQSDYGEFKLEKNWFGDGNFLTKTIFFLEEEIIENWKLISGSPGKSKKLENKRNYRIKLEQRLEELQAELSVARREEEKAYLNFIQSK